MKGTVDSTQNSGEKGKIDRTSDGRFVPGHSVHKPKGSKHFSTLFKEILQEEIELKDKNGKVVKMTMSRAMGLAIARKAIRGDVQAFNALSDRVDGKPKMDMELEVTEMPTPIYGGLSTKPKRKP